MKKIFFLIPMLSASLLLHAQTSSTAPTNQNFASQNPGIGGWFDVIKNVGGRDAHYEVNYGLYSKPFVNSMVMTMNTSNPVILHAEIINSMGTKVQDWGPVNIGYKYKYTFDISTLTVGRYMLNIYDDLGNKVCSQAFDKSSN